MKRILFAISIAFIGCTTKGQSPGPIDITWEIAPGLHYCKMIIGSDSVKVQRLYQKSTPPSFDSIYKTFIVHTHIVRPEVEKYILEYIKAHCAPYEKTNVDADDLFFIGIYNEGGRSNISCMIKNKPKAIPYFKGLKTWIEHSPYAAESKYILLDLQKKFIEGGEFPFTPEQEKIMKEKTRTKNGK